MKSKNKLIVIISVVMGLAAVSVILAYLFLMTDTFKSKKELFAKYFAQNEDAFQKITDLVTVENFEKLKNENKYELNTSIEMVHSEGGEISNPLNNLEAKLDFQKNNDQQYIYANAQILYEDERYLEAEIIKEQEKYGVRLPDAVKQFVTIKNDEKLETIANDMGVDVSYIQEIINVLDGKNLSVDVEQIHTLKDKYLNIITKEVSNGIFEKQKNAMITYNDVTIETNAYSVFLSSEQIEKILIEILNNIKNETEMLDKVQILTDKETLVNKIDEKIKAMSEEISLPTVKATVYEKNEQTIRTVVEIGVYKIVIENTDQEGQLTTKINYSDSNNGMQMNVEVDKNNTETDERFGTIINITKNEKNYELTFSNQMKLIDNQMETDTKISYKQDITDVSMVLKNKITINDFEKMETLSAENNTTLNDLEEQRMKDVISVLKQVMPQVLKERIEIVKQKIELGNVQTEDTEMGDEITQIEINKFNSKFEFYTGDEVSAENVKTLLNIVKDHLANYEVIENETQQDANNVRPQTEKLNIKLNIEKDVSNQEIINQVLEKIEDRAKYKVLIFYKQENGLIEYITLTEI